MANIKTCSLAALIFVSTSTIAYKEENRMPDFSPNRNREKALLKGDVYTVNRVSVDAMTGDTISTLLSEYDKLGNLTSWHDTKGQIKEVMKYRRGLIQSSIIYFPPIDKEVAMEDDISYTKLDYSYDRKGHLTRQVWNTKHYKRRKKELFCSERYEYDEYGRLSKVYDTMMEGDQYSLIRYNEKGQITSYGDYLRVDYEYNELGQIAKITDQDKESIYEYNALGNTSKIYNSYKREKRVSNSSTNMTIEIADSLASATLEKCRSIDLGDYSSISIFEYEYDSCDNWTKMAEVCKDAFGYKVELTYRKIEYYK